MSVVTIIKKFSNLLISKPQPTLTLVIMLSIFGPLVILSGGIWDAISHFLKEPEFFWTIQHVVVYGGVTMIASAYTGFTMSASGGVLGSILVIRKFVTRNMKKGIIIFLVGCIIQLVFGYADFISHEIFGLDGLVSWSHQPLELGLVLTTLGGFLMIKSLKYGKIKRFVPVSIISLIFSISWLGFNLSLLLGGTILCLPFYEIFSSGFAIL